MLAEAEHSLLSELRAATGAQHAALDAELGLLEGALSRQRYQAFLRGSLLALAPLEAALAAFAPNGISRSRLIRADLEALGSSVPVAATEHGGVRIEHLAQAFGARYVVEGSALGGAVLARAFQKALAPEQNCWRFLTLHGERLGEHWRAFLVELETWGKTATFEMRSDACDTARAVFDHYAGAFAIAGAMNEP